MLGLASAGNAVAQEPPPDSTPVVVEGQALRKALFTAIDMPRLSDPRTACEATVLEAALLALYAGGSAPPLGPDAAADEFASLRASYRAMRGSAPCEQRFVDEGILDLLQFAEGSATLGDATRNAIRIVARDALAVSGENGGGIGDRALTALDDLGESIATGALAPERLLGRAIDEAAVDPDYARARDRLLGPETGASITADVATLRDHPAVQAAGISSLISDGRVTTTFGVVMGRVSDAVVELATVRDQALTDLAAHNAGTLAPPQADTNSDQRDKAVDDQERLLSFSASVVEQAGRSGTTEVERRLAEQGIQVRAIGKVSGAAARLIGRAVRAMAVGATRVLDGFVHAARSIANGFARLARLATTGSFEDRNQRILDALAGVRADIAELRTEMNARFDRIDAKLDQIYGTLLTRFDELYVKLDQLEQGIQEVRDGIVRLSSQIERLERNVYGLFRDSQDRELWTQINTAIGWRDRSVGGAAMSNSQFLEYEGFFYSWATQSAYDTIAVGPPSRAYDEASIEGELATVPLEGNLPYLSGLGVARFGLAPLSSGPLPNLRDFTIAARAYSALLHENPEFVTDGIRSRVDTLLSRGRQVADALANVTRQDTPGVGTGSRAFNAALDLYRRAGTAPESGGTHSVASALAAVEGAYVAGLKSAKGNPLGLDPWGSRSQTPPLDSDTPYTIEICKASTAPGAAKLNTPSNFGRTDAYSTTLRNAMRLGAVEGRTVCKVTASNQRTVGSSGSKTDHYADFRVEFSTEFATSDRKTVWNTVLSKSKTYADVLWCTSYWTDECTTLDPFTEAAERWEYSIDNPQPWKGQFESTATTTTPGLAAFSLDRETDAAFTELRRGIYSHILSKLDVEPLRTALARLNGAKGVLEAYTEFGLWRDLYSDSGLRGLLYGDQQLLSQGPEQLIGAQYATARDTPTSSNVRHSVVSLIGSRATALESKLATIVTETNAASASASRSASSASAGAGLRTNPLLETTLARLALTRNLPAPAPPEGPATDPPGGGGPVAPPAGEQPFPPADPLTSVRVGKASLRKIAKGLTVRLAAARPGRVEARLAVSRKTAKKLKLPRSGLLAKAARSVGAGGAKLTLRPAKAAAKRLRRAKRVKATLTLVFVEPDGRRQELRRKLTLKR